MELPGTGNSQIDQGHERLMALLEKLRYNPPEVDPILQELDGCLRAHFQEEEALMRAIHYRGVRAHAAEHAALGGLLTLELPEEIHRAADYDGILRSVDRGRQAFMDHVLGLDQKLALYLLRKQQREQRRKPARRTAKPRKAVRA